MLLPVHSYHIFNLSSSVRDKRKLQRRLSCLQGCSQSCSETSRRFIIDRTAVSLRPRSKPGRTSVTSRSNLASRSHRSFAGQHASINPTRSLYLNSPLFFIPPRRAQSAVLVVDAIYFETSCRRPPDGCR